MEKAIERIYYQMMRVTIELLLGEVQGIRVVQLQEKIRNSHKSLRNQEKDSKKMRPQINSKVRNPNLVLRISQGLEHKRARALNPQTIAEFYTNLKSLYNEHHYD